MLNAALVDSITGASDGLSVIDATTSWTFETTSSERIGVVIFLVVVAFLVVVVVDFTVVVSDFSVAVVGGCVATFEVVTTVVVVLFGGIPVGPTPILNPFVTQSSNSCFLSSILVFDKPVQVKVINSDKLGQMNNKLKGLHGLHELSGLLRF